MRLWIPLKRLGEPRDRTTGPSYCGTTHLSCIVSFPVGTTVYDFYLERGACLKTGLLASNGISNVFKFEDATQRVLSHEARELGGFSLTMDLICVQAGKADG